MKDVVLTEMCNFESKLKLVFTGGSTLSLGVAPKKRTGPAGRSVGKEGLLAEGSDPG
jgi:hypothetical protein